MTDVNRSKGRAGSLSEAAYDRLESMIVSTQLRPGSGTTLKELEELAGLGRTPVHDAVKRLAANQLIVVNPRVGLKIASIDLPRERILLELRTEMEMFACRLATERASLNDHKLFRRFIGELKTAGENLSLERFNVVDRQLNKAITSASKESFLDNTLGPLQTLYRRIGWLYATHVAGTTSLKNAVAVHIELLETVIAGDGTKTAGFVRSMLAENLSIIDAVRREVDPALLDAGVSDTDFETGF